MGECWAEVRLGGRWGWEEVVEAKAVRPPLGTTPIQPGPPSPRSSPLLFSPLRTCFPGPRFLAGCLVWVTGCRLPVYWEGTDSNVKARQPVECREEEVEGVWGVLDKHITWNREAHSIVSCAISAVSCYELCLSYISAGAAFMILPYIGWSKYNTTWRYLLLYCIYILYLLYFALLHSSRPSKQDCSWAIAEKDWWLILLSYYGYIAIRSLEVDSFSGSGVIYGLLRKESPNNSEDESHHSP